MAGDEDDYIYDHQSIETARIFTIFLASISSLFPASVVFILFQRYESLVRGKSLIHYVLMIAIADTLTSIAISFGFPPVGTLCSVQSFFIVLFGRMSWYYTVVLIFQLFYIVVFKKYFLNKRYMHLIVWTLNVLLAGTRYGRSVTEHAVNRCFFYDPNGNEQKANMWKQYTFRIELFVCFTVIIVLSVIVVIYSQCMNDTKTSHVYLAQRIRESWSIVILYPLAMLVAWVPSTVWGFKGDYTSSADKNQAKPYQYFVIADYLSACQALYGPLLATIFYSKTLDARRALLYNLRCIVYTITEADIDERTTCSSIISIEDKSVGGISLSNMMWSKKEIKVPNSIKLASIMNNGDEINPIRISKA